MSDELTPREKQAARLAASGLSNKQVGDSMGIEASTVKQYLHQVYSKTGVCDRSLLCCTSYPASQK